jgi:hypothetical protein
MEEKILNWLSSLTFPEDEKEMIKSQNEILKIKDSLFLHIIAGNYNWDDGFEMPSAIINNQFCDLGTALMIFYLAEGEVILDLKLNRDVFGEWEEFVYVLYDMILNDSFKYKNISYTPELSKVQLYKIKKKNPNAPSVFLEKTPGDIIKIPYL